MKNQNRIRRNGGKSASVPQGQSPVETAAQSAPQIPPAAPPGEHLCGFDDADFKCCDLHKVDSQHFIVERCLGDNRFEHVPLTRSAARELLVESVIPEEFRRDLSFPSVALRELERAHQVALAIILRRCESIMNPVEWTDVDLKEAADAGECEMATDAMQRLQKAFNNVWVACGGTPDSVVEGGAR